MTKQEDRRVARTKQNLADALIDLILQKGYEKVSVQNIVDRANIGRTTFYAHFQDKDDLLRHSVGTLDDLVDEAVGFEEMLTQLIAHATESGRLFQVFLQAPPLRDALVQWLARKLQDHGRADNRAASYFLAGGLVTVLRWWHLNKRDEPIDTITLLIKQQMAAQISPANPAPDAQVGQPTINYLYLRVMPEQEPADLERDLAIIQALVEPIPGAALAHRKPEPHSKGGYALFFECENHARETLVQTLHAHGFWPCV